MSLHFFLEKKKRLLRERDRLIATIFAVILFCSCKAQNHDEIIKEKDAISVNECALKRLLKTEIQENINRFKTRLHQNPTVIRVTFLRSDNKTKARFTTKANLYVTKEEKELANENFLYATIVDGVTILIIKNNNLEVIDKFCVNKNHRKSFDIFYGGDMNICNRSYVIENDAFKIEKDECPLESFSE